MLVKVRDSWWEPARSEWRMVPGYEIEFTGAELKSGETLTITHSAPQEEHE